MSCSLKLNKAWILETRAWFTTPSLYPKSVIIIPKLLIAWCCFCYYMLTDPFCSLLKCTINMQKEVVFFFSLSSCYVSSFINHKDHKCTICTADIAAMVYLGQEQACSGYFQIQFFLFIDWLPPQSKRNQSVPLFSP